MTEAPSQRVHFRAALVDLIAKRGGGRVVAPTVDGLGAAVVSDYLRTRRSR